MFATGNSQLARAEDCVRFYQLLFDRMLVDEDRMSELLEQLRRSGA